MTAVDSFKKGDNGRMIVVLTEKDLTFERVKELIEEGKKDGAAMPTITYRGKENNPCLSEVK